MGRTRDTVASYWGHTRILDMWNIEQGYEFTQSFNRFVIKYRFSPVVGLES